MRVGLAMILAAVFLAACAPAAEKKDESPFVRGRAKVVSVDQGLGRVVLDYQNQKVEAYWQTELGYAQGGSLARSDSPFKPAVGLYREPNVKSQEFDGKPGDTVDFTCQATGTLVGTVAVHAVLSGVLVNDAG